MLYKVQVANDIKFKDIVVNKIVENYTNYNLDDELEWGVQYYWRVKTIDDYTGSESAWSSVCSFRLIEQDTIVETNYIDSYMMYGSEAFGLYHKFVRDYDFECDIPNAVLDVCMPPMGVAQLDVCYCSGITAPSWDQ